MNWHASRLEQSSKSDGGTFVPRGYFVDESHTMSIPDTMSILKPGHLEDAEELLGFQMPTPALQTIQGPSAADWERLQPVIRRLYIDEGRTLNDIMDIMLSRYGHKAT